MNDLTVHICNLFSHFSDLILSGTNISLELFDFVIQDKFEFLKFLSFLLELIYTCDFVSDCFLPFFDLLGLRLLSLKILFMFLLDLLNIFKCMLQFVLFLFKRSLLLLKNFLLGKFFIFSFIIRLFKNFYIRLIVFFLRFDLNFSLVFILLLIVIALSPLDLKSFFKNSTIIFLFVKFFFKLYLFLLFLLDMSIFDGTDELIKLFVFCFLSFAKLTKPGLLKLYLVSIIFFNSLSLNFMLIFQLIQFLDMFFLHSIYFFNFPIILYLLCSLPVRYFVVQLID